MPEEIFLKNPTQEQLEAVGVTFDQRDLKKALSDKVDTMMTEFLETWSRVYSGSDATALTSASISMLTNISIDMHIMLAVTTESPEYLRRQSDVFQHASDAMTRLAKELEEELK